jgi:hypothetical protein
MANEILLAGSFFVSAILVQVIGTLIADSRNHKRNLEKMREEGFYNKKIEFIEELSKVIEDKRRKHAIIRSKIIFYNLEKIKKEKEKLKDEIQVLIGECLKETYFNLKMSNFLYIENEKLVNLISNLSMQEFMLASISKNFGKDIVEIDKRLEKIDNETREILILIQKELGKKKIIIPIHFQKTKETMNDKEIEELSQIVYNDLKVLNKLKKIK